MQLVEFTSMNDAQRAFEHQQIDGGMFSIFEVLRVRDQSQRDLQPVLVVDYSDGADAVLARAHVATLADLKGKTIGIDLGPLGIYMLDRALARYGMTLDDVRLVQTTDPALEETLRKGTVDAVVSYPPTRTSIEAAGLARPIFTSREMPGEIADVMAFDGPMIRGRQAEIAAVIRAFYRAVDYARVHPEEAMRIMARREGLSPESFSQALGEGITLVPLAEQPRILAPDSQLSKTVESIARVLHRRGELSSPIVQSPLLAPGPAIEATQ